MPRLGLGTSLSKSGLITPGIVTDSLVLKHNYAAGGVVPVSDGAAYLLASATDYIDLGNDSSIQMGTSDFSICAWIKKASDGANVNILSYGRQDASFWFFRIDDNNKFEMYSNDGTGTSLISASTITGTGWNHVALSWDRDSATGAKLYINGVLDAERDGTDEQATLTHASHGMLIGVRRTTGTTLVQYWDGYICNVGLWKGEALTQAQIKSIMWKNYAGLTSSETTNLVSWWNLDEETATDGTAGSGGVKDSHGSNHGDLE